MCECNKAVCVTTKILCLRQVHRLVVVDDDMHVVGVVSLSDLLYFLVLQPANEARARKQSAGSSVALSLSSGKSSPKTVRPSTPTRLSQSAAPSASQQPVSTITLLSQGHQPPTQSTAQQQQPQAQHSAYSPLPQSSATQRPKSAVIDKGKVSPKQVSPRGTPSPTIGGYKSKTPAVDGHGGYSASGPSPQHPLNRAPRTG